MFLEYSATYLLFWALIGALYGLAAINRHGAARPHHSTAFGREPQAS
jgi:hypothetical protein